MKKEEETYNLCSSNFLYWKIEKNLWVIIKSIPTTKKKSESCFSDAKAMNPGFKVTHVWLLNRVEENHVSFFPNKPKIARIMFGSCRLAFGLLKPNQTDAEYLSNKQL